MPHTLTDDERRFFAENGYLILRGAVERSLTDRVEEQLWNALDIGRDDPGAWAKRDNIRLDRPDETREGAIREMARHPNVFGVAEQFVGAGATREPAGLDVLITWPRPGSTWAQRTRGHIDGYNIPFQYNPFTIGATLYGTSVAHAGGAFTFWPGSHRRAWQYFQSHPWLDFDGHDPFSHNDALGGALGPGEEFIGEPGDVLFWHFLLTHSGSGNAGTVPRFGLIGRFSRPDMREVIADRPASLWKYWAGMQGFE